jgi:hypothetical protein
LLGDFFVGDLAFEGDFFEATFGGADFFFEADFLLGRTSSANVSLASEANSPFDNRGREGDFLLAAFEGDLFVGDFLEGDLFVGDFFEATFGGGDLFVGDFLTPSERNSPLGDLGRELAAAEREGDFFFEADFAFDGDFLEGDLFEGITCGANSSLEICDLSRMLEC